jgi:pyrroloquinoline quinone biosynthesis protein E
MAPRPWNLIAELTYRCPLRCPYCSNPTALDEFPDALDTAVWGDVFRQAAALGVVHVGLTGGEPSVRRDLPEIVEAAAAAQHHVHLVTAGLPLDASGLAELKARGLGSLQLSIQDAQPEASEHIAGGRSWDRKLALAEAARELQLPLTLNVVLHRANLARTGELVDLAARLGAQRVELANTQYHGWALRNRSALLPSRVQLERASEEVERARARHPQLEIVFVLPDYFADRPKPCMGGWGRKNLVVAPDGRVLPCHAAAELRHLEFYRVPEQSLRAAWEDSPGMNAYRGEAWMKEPCRSCPARARDHGGCRCQSFALTGDATETDPACELSPRHALIEAARPEADSADDWVYRSRT